MREAAMPGGRKPVLSAHLHRDAGEDWGEHRGRPVLEGGTRPEHVGGGSGLEILRLFDDAVDQHLEALVAQQRVAAGAALLVDNGELFQRRRHSVDRARADVGLGEIEDGVVIGRGADVLIELSPRVERRGGLIHLRRRFRSRVGG